MTDQSDPNSAPAVPPDATATPPKPPRNAPSAAKLCRLIHHNNGSITPRQLQHKVRCYRGPVAKAQQALQGLQQAGFVAWDQDSKAYLLTPEGVRESSKGSGHGGHGAVTSGGSGGVSGDNYSPLGAVPAAGEIRGLDRFPPHWPELPPKVALAAELTWCQANRLAIVEHRPNGSAVVHLDRAAEPAPSRSTFAWLETSIRNYGKYVDLVARTLKDELDEAEIQRHERMAIEEIDEIIFAMMRDYSGEHDD